MDAVITLPSGGEVTCASYFPPASCWGTIEINTSNTPAKKEEKNLIPLSKNRREMNQCNLH